MIVFSKGEGLIKATGIRKLDGTRDVNYKLPHIAVGVFSEYLLEDIEKTEQKNCISVGDVKKTRFKIGFHMTIAEINNINTRTRLDQIIEGVDNLFENIL